MLLSSKKSECSFFPTDSHESKWQPTLTLDVRCNATPEFLGVTYVRQLTFYRYAALVGNRLKRQAGALRQLVYVSWGYDQQILRATYIASGRSKVEYNASSWLLWISNSTLDNQGRSQRCIGRAIIGQLRITPVEAIQAEMSLSSIMTRAIQLSTIAMGKSLMKTNPPHATATKRVRQRNQRPSWREEAGGVWQKIFGDTKPTMIPPLKSPLTDTGTYTFELTGQKKGDTASDHSIAT